MIEHAHEQHDIEAFAERSDVIDGEAPKFDFDLIHFRSKPRLLQVLLLRIDSKNPRRAAPLHLEGVESGIAADIEDGAAGEIRRDLIGKPIPFDGGVIAEEMRGSGAHAVEIEIVEPGAQRLDT